MKKVDVRSYGSMPISGRLCGVEGCNELSCVGEFCQTCAQEIRRLHGMAALTDERRSTCACGRPMWGSSTSQCGLCAALRVMRDTRSEQRTLRIRFAALCDAVPKRLWIANLIFVLGGVLYVAAKWAPAIADWLNLWLGSGGGQ